ncbi:MAG: amino acid adenylation domain-containing protein [Ruminiclostridium sp.]|nr:amino acid adenylation domain-containing protein [Ruminiclostridium sp.]
MLSKENIQNIYHLSAMQKNIYYQYVNNPGALSYFEQISYRVNYSFDINLVKSSYTYLVKQHDVLRTVLVQKKDEVLQVVLNEREVEFRFEGIINKEEKEGYISKFKTEDRNRLFDLKKDNLIRLAVFRVDENVYEFIWSFHHIILDGWSTGILINNFFMIYMSGDKYSLSRIPQYNTYIRWLEKQDFNKAREYWTGYLEDYEEAASLYPNTNSEEGGYKKGRIVLRLSEEVTKALLSLAQKNNITLNTVIHTIWGVMLAKYNRTNDVVFGVVVSGRPSEIDGINSMVGLFINTIPIRVQYSKDTRLNDLLKQVQESAINSEKYQYIDLAEIQAITKQNIINHILVFENYPIADAINEIGDDGFKIEKTDVFEQTNYDLNILIVPKSYMEFHFDFNSNIYSQDFIERLTKHLQCLILNILKNADSAISDIDILLEEEKNKILYEFNNTECNYPANKVIHELFMEQAKKYSENTALLFNGKAMSYSELDNKSSKLALYLRSKGVGRNKCIGLMMHRSFEMMIGILAILKAGGVYVPIDPIIPFERQKYILEDCGAQVVLTERTLWNVDLGVGVEVVFQDNEELFSCCNGEVKNINEPNDLVYIIYTSGSTGEPKGVAIEHCSLMNRINWMNKAYPITPDDIIMQKTSISFDVSIWELFWWIFEGAKQCLLTPNGEKDPLVIIDTIERNNVTIMHFVPSMFQAFLDVLEDNKSLLSMLKPLKYIFTSGEELLLNQVNKFFKTISKESNALLINLYGPTEATVDVSYFNCIKENVTNVIPIGKPIDNIKLFIVNELNNLVPIGVPGELCIAGVGVARGYINKPELTDEKFIKCSFLNNERIYKTGDLARWLPDGNIEFLGRIDRQVKVRGYRIEIGEIENRILEIESISKAVVVAKKDKNNITTLYTYYVRDSGDKANEQDLMYYSFNLKATLSQKLPEYMIPAFFIELDDIPLLPNGKVNRNAFPDSYSILGKDINIAVTEYEGRLITIWSEILNIEPQYINPYSNYFELGGHSLNIITLISRIHKEYDIRIRPNDVFKFPTVKELVFLLQSLERNIYSRIPIADKKEYYILTPAQKRLFILQQLESNSMAYNVTLVRIVEGNIDIHRLQKAVEQLVVRHESLRTTIESRDDGLFQKIHEFIQYSIEEFKTEGFECVEIITSDFVRPFDLRKAPLFRVGLINCGNAENVIIIDMHHIITDFISLHRFLNELMVLYNNTQPTPLRIQYKDYAEWLDRPEQQAHIREQRDYWLQELKGEIPLIDIPADFVRPRIFSHKGNTIEFELNGEVIKKLKDFALQSNVTMFMLMYSIFNILLAKLSGSSDIIVGIPAIVRPHNDLEDIIGNFLNTLAIRTYSDNNKRYGDYLKEVSGKILKALENQMYPFEELVNNVPVSRDISRNPLFDVFFSYQNANVPPDMGDIKIYPYDFNNKTSKFDLSLYGIEAGEKIVFKIEYYAELFKKETAERFVKYFKAILEQIIENPEIRIMEINTLPEDEKYQILHCFNNTKFEYRRDKCIHELFEEQVTLNPDKVALVFEEEELTYTQLNRRANQVARVLREKGVKTGCIVGIMVERSLEMIIGILGILKSGGAYLPIDPEYPQERKGYMLQDSNAELLLTKHGLESLNEKECSDLVSINSSKDLAYIIYTSGSTGKPKGVMIEHLAVNNFIEGVTRLIDFSPHKTILALTSVSFDIFVLETLLPLVKGLKVVIANEEQQKSPKHLSKVIIEKKIDILQMTPSRMQLFINDSDSLHCLKDLKEILIGGEALNQSLFEKLRSITQAKLYNMYGPTETTVWSAIKDLTVSETVNIGRPIANTQIYIVDENNYQQPIGVAGELCIAGDGLARGYLERPEHTADRFVPNPFRSGERMYKTGDYAKWLPDGDIQFIGRRDNQVKVRGFRIELGEIEDLLTKHELVKEAAVIDREDIDGNKYLCAYIVSEVELPVSEIKSYLSKYLPYYMIPSFTIRLEKLPTTLNGKIDRKILPALEWGINIGLEYVAPQNELEAKIADIWKGVLGVEKIGINDNFFDIGGNSLLVIKLEAEMEKANFTISAIEIYEHKTIKGLTDYISGNEKTDIPNTKKASDIDESRYSSDNRVVMGGIKPFNEIFFKSCFYNSFFPVIHYFGRSEMPILVNDIIVYDYHGDISTFGIKYLPARPIKQVISDTRIDSKTKERCRDVVEDIIIGLRNGRPVIIWIDCFYESIRQEMYHRRHWLHTLLIYGFDRDRRIFNITEHLYSDNLTYEKRVISFDDVIAAYEGYLVNFKTDEESPSYYELFSEQGNEVDELEKYKGIYLDNIRMQKDAFIGQLEQFKTFIEEFKNTVADEAKLGKNVEMLVERISDVINAKRVEMYRVSKLFGEDLIQLLNGIIENWGAIRSVLAKYMYKSVYRQGALATLVGNIEQIYQCEQRYCDSIAKQLTVEGEVENNFS